MRLEDGRSVNVGKAEWFEIRQQRARLWKAEAAAKLQPVCGKRNPQVSPLEPVGFVQDSGIGPPRRPRRCLPRQHAAHNYQRWCCASQTRYSAASTARLGKEGSVPD